MTFNRLVSFDFDDTLCETPLPNPSIQIWEQKMKSVYPNNPEKWNWPHTGDDRKRWWTQPESLDLSVFDIPKIEWVYQKYLSEVVRESTFLFMATGRIEPLRKQVQDILNYHNLSFDEIYLNFGTDTFLFKTKLFENLIERYQPEIFVMYDDRKTHLPRFEEWAISQPCLVSIVDVVNKTTKTFNN
jgi:hypothetical protein